MNIAEQLSRLEKSEDPLEGESNKSHHVGIGNTFGWKRLDETSGPMAGRQGVTGRDQSTIPVVNSEGEAYVLCPEELIMNVASWVQETYLTAPVF